MNSSFLMNFYKHLLFEDLCIANGVHAYSWLEHLPKLKQKRAKKPTGHI